MTMTDAEVPIRQLKPGQRFELHLALAGKAYRGTLVRAGAGGASVLIDGHEVERTFQSREGKEVRIRTSGGVTHWSTSTPVIPLNEFRDIARWLGGGANNRPEGGQAAGPQEEGGTMATQAATQRGAALLAQKPGPRSVRESARAAARAKAKGGTKARTPKALNPCKCGCGEKVAGSFRQGHDGRYYGLLKKVAAEVLPFTKLPALMQSEAGNIAGVKTILRKSKH